MKIGQEFSVVYSIPNAERDYLTLVLTWIVVVVVVVVFLGAGVSLTPGTPPNKTITNG